MNIIRLTVTCAQDSDHSKLLKISAELGMEWAQTFAELLCGTSPFYVHKPGPNSSIGKCATCGGRLNYTLEEAIESAKSEK